MFQVFCLNNMNIYEILNIAFTRIYFFILHDILIFVTASPDSSRLNQIICKGETQIQMAHI